MHSDPARCHQSRKLFEIPTVELFQKSKALILNWNLLHIQLLSPNVHLTAIVLNNHGSVPPQVPKLPEYPKKLSVVSVRQTVGLIHGPSLMLKWRFPALGFSPLDVIPLVVVHLGGPLVSNTRPVQVERICYRHHIDHREFDPAVRLPLVSKRIADPDKLRKGEGFGIAARHRCGTSPALQVVPRDNFCPTLTFPSFAHKSFCKLISYPSRVASPESLCQNYSQQERSLVSMDAQNRLFAMLTVYLDESGTDGKSPIVMGGGYLSTVKRWEEFAIDWDKFVKEEGLAYYHRTDIAGVKGKIEAEMLEQRAIAVIHKHILFGVLGFAEIAACVKRNPHFNSETKEGRRPFSTEYAFAAMKAFLRS